MTRLYDLISRYATWAVLLVMLVLVSTDSVGGIDVKNPVDGFTPEELLGVLAIFLFISAVIQVVCEIFIEMLTATKVLPPDPVQVAPDPATAQHQKDARKAAGRVLCLAMGLIACSSGFLLMSMTFQAVGVTGIEGEAWFQRLDYVATAFLFAGGADGFHQVLKSFRTAHDKGTSIIGPGGIGPGGADPAKTSQTGI